MTNKTLTPTSLFSANESVDRSETIDSLARQSALDPKRSFAVSAPAGSGKTGLLTQRLLKLLSLSENPEDVLAITFTRKAAGEMQDRVLQALWNAKDKPEPNNSHELLTWKLATQVLAQNQIRGWNLLECPQRLRIQTIDSLCSSIARQLPIASGFGSQPNPSDDSASAYQQAVEQLLTQLESETSLGEDLTQLLEHLDNNLTTLENLLIALVAKRDQWLEVILLAKHQDARLYLESVLKEIISDHLADAKKILLLHASELASITDWAASNLAEYLPDSPIALLKGMQSLPSTELSGLDHWLAIIELLLTKEGTFRKSLNKNQGFPAAKENKASASYKERFSAMVQAISEQHSDAADIINYLRSLPPCRYDDSQWALLDCLTRLLPRLAASVDLVFADLGESDFTAVSQAALSALGSTDSPSDLALQLDHAIQHILVDEFQDTSSTQLELLQKLTSGWQSGDGRSVFIVGDGMQSCYSFRNANVGIFLEVRARGLGELKLEKLDLSVNFRSQGGIVNWVNQQFQDAFPQQDDISRGAVKYSPSHSIKPKLDEPAVDIYLSPYRLSETESHGDQKKNDDSSQADEIRSYYDEQYVAENYVVEEHVAENHVAEKYRAELQEAEAVANLIKKIRDENPDESVALLARSRNHLQQIFPAMKRQGLSWQSTDIDSLAERMAIIDLTSLTRALLNYADRIAWLAILRAPWCGLDLNDLHKLANNEKNPSITSNNFPIIWQQVLGFEKIPGLSESGKQALARFVDVIQPALAARQRKPLRKWIEGVWLALGGPATLLETEDLNNIPTFFALLEQHQQAGNIKDWERFTRAVAKLYAAPRQDADEKLQVMTMHKAKGLEFDHVIIPRLHKVSPKDGQQLILWREHLSRQGERQLLLGPLAPVGQDKDPLYKYIQKESALQLHHEATRLFYVGCTRAIKKLYLFASLSQTNEGTWKNPPKNSLLNCLWKNLSQNVQSTVNTIAGTRLPLNKISPQFERPGLQHLLRLTTTWCAPSLSDNEILKKYRGSETDDEENLPIAETYTAKLARFTGSLIHRALQNLVGVSGKVNPQQWQEGQLPLWQLLLKQQGFSDEDVTRAIQKISKAVHNTLSDSHGKWILDNSHQDSQCELAITHKEATIKEGLRIDLKLRESIIDRTFVTEGIRWIIDYKSSEPHSNQSVTEFMIHESAAYRSQLIRYKSCFVALGETHIKTALYFPLLENEPRLTEVALE
jgi:ATP-dependent helicase/nuclease subunit A